MAEEPTLGQQASETDIHGCNPYGNLIASSPAYRKWHEVQCADRTPVLERTYKGNISLNQKIWPCYAEIAAYHRERRTMPVVILAHEVVSCADSLLRYYAAIQQRGKILETLEQLMAVADVWSIDCREANNAGARYLDDVQVSKDILCVVAAEPG
ncbi:MAG: hypothetical protein C4308_15065, partial [Chitinophagaceae bacterium]